MPSRPRSGSAPEPVAGTATVIRLQDYKAVRRAAVVLEGLLHEPPWLRDVRGSVTGGQVRIVVRLRYFTPDAQTCTPSRVNSIPVEIAWDE